MTCPNWNSKSDFKVEINKLIQEVLKLLHADTLPTDIFSGIHKIKLFSLQYYL